MKKAPAQQEPLKEEGSFLLFERGNVSRDIINGFLSCQSHCHGTHLRSISISGLCTASSGFEVFNLAYQDTSHVVLTALGRLKLCFRLLQVRDMIDKAYRMLCLRQRHLLQWRQLLLPA